MFTYLNLILVTKLVQITYSTRSDVKSCLHTCQR